jgi:hypothetical protein
VFEKLGKLMTSAWAAEATTRAVAMANDFMALSFKCLGAS